MADTETRLTNKEQVKQLTDRLAEGVKELFASEKYAEYLRALPRLRRYSPRNALLIQMQMPEATLVAGYQTWQTKYGRFVKQGEHGIKILAPTPFTVKREQQRIDPVTRQPVLGLDGLPETEIVEQRLARFKATTVFDVSQTDGKPLPTLAEELTGNVEHYGIFLETLRAVSPLPIVFENLPADTDGVCRFGDRIAIREGMSEIQTVVAIIHEITHAKLHDKALQNENAPPKDNRTKEVEAESVAFAVCARYGIETDANSFGYVASWSSNKELKELNASHEIIHNTAAELIDSIDTVFRRLAKERGVELSAAISSSAPEKAEITMDKEAMMAAILAELTRIDPGFPARALQGIEQDMRAKSIEDVREDYYFYFPRERAIEQAPPEPSREQAAPANDAPSEMLTRYSGQIVSFVMADPAYTAARASDDISVARRENAAAIGRAITDLILDSPEHMPLAKEYIENPGFQEQLRHHVFMKTYLEVKAAERDAAREAAGESFAPPRGNTTAHRNYAKFAELFPQIVSGEYRYMRFEAGGMEPLSVQYVGSDQVSIMHTYLENGDTFYDPDIVVELDTVNGTLNALSFEQSNPPLYQRVEENGDGLSVDGNGNQREVRGLQRQINDFASKWFSNIEQQGFIPVRAVKEINGTDVEIAFDNLGNPIQPEPPKPEQEPPTPEKEYDINYGHMGNGLTIWNRLEEKNGDYVTVAHIGPDRAVTFYDKDMPDSVKAKIEDIAMYSDARVSVTQQDQRVFHTPPKEYALSYNEIPVTGVEVYNERREQVAEFLETGKVRFIDNGIPQAAKDEINARAKAMAEQREAGFLNGEGDAYGIYLRDPDSGDAGISKENYRLAYFGRLEDGDTLDTIRAKFSEEPGLFYEYHPRENGPEFGPGDIIVMKQGGEITPWYVDGLAFSQQNDFFGAPDRTAARAPDAPVEDAEPDDIDVMPDPSIGYSERDLFGYTDNDMLPLTQLTAVELFECDHTIYLLHPDNTEAMAFSAEEIVQHDGLYGIERGEWLASPEYESMKQAAASAEQGREAALLYGNENSFGIYQLKSGVSNSYSWASMKELEADGLTVDRANYELVHTAPLVIRDTLTNLHKIVGDYNVNPPEDFKGHSPSTSDVIVLQWRGEVSSHYVDGGFGFADLPSFTGAEGQGREPTPEQAPVTDYTSSQVGNTMDTAQTEPPKAAETEPGRPDSPAPPPPQGKEPTVAELTAKAEAGEQISVMALLAAIKREKGQAPEKSAAPFREAPGQHTERG